MIPVGYCQCGCGQKTKICDRNVARDGYKKGVPFRFLQSHHRNGQGSAEQNSNWQESPVKATGNVRAYRWFKNIPACTECGNPKSERHHKDGNTLNNDPSNIAFLCRRCHMKADGRLNRFIAARKVRAKQGRKP